MKYEDRIQMIRKLSKDTYEKNNKFRHTPYFLTPKNEKPKSVNDKMEEAQIEDFEQNTKLKKKSLSILWIFLAAETVLVFIIAFLQGFKVFGFVLEEWSFHLLVVVTISQITYMLKIAIYHLFPIRDDNKK